MIEVCADIGNHIIADTEFRTPKSYADTFQVLGEEGILTPDLSLTMQDVAKFRNIVVHGYDKIDETIVVSILRTRLDDFSAYEESVLAFLSGSAD